ncbi:MAG: nonstructural protein [Microvirus sp.]|nr:MAG: nonstructural protein [Microvirus sp.]
MKYFIFAVRDRAADVFGTPYYSVSRGSAIRGFSDEVNRREPGNTLSAHPEDFDLYVLGTFDDAGGVFDVKSPEMIAVGKDFVKPIN